MIYNDAAYNDAAFRNQEWFFQLLVWFDFLIDPIPRIVLETGTHRGAGARRWAEFFDEVHTVELSKELYEHASLKYKDYKNITFYHDKSPDFLRKLLPQLNEQCIVFLDAHGSGGDTTFDENVGRFGSPLLDEISAIRDCANIDPIIVIDDCDDLGTMNYPTKLEIEDAILAINPNYNVELNIPKHLLLSRGTGLAYL